MVGLLVLLVPAGRSWGNEPAIWIPADAESIVHLDWAAVRSSFPLLGVEELLERHLPPAALEEFRQATGTDPIRDAHAVTVFTRSAEDEEASWGVVVFGAFDPTGLVSLLDARQSSQKRTYEGATIHHFPTIGGGSRDSRELHAIAFPDSGTALIGSDASVERMLEVGFGLAPALDEGLLVPIAYEVAHGDLWAASLRSGIRSLVRGKDHVVPELRSVGVALRFGLDIEVELYADSDSVHETRRFADFVRGLLAVARLAEPKASSVEIDSRDERLEVRFEIDGRQVREWLAARH